MGIPSGRRTRHYTVYLSGAELEVLEAARSTRLMPQSRADFLLDVLEPIVEQAAANGDERCQKALQGLDEDEKKARENNFQDNNRGRPPKISER